MPSQTRLSHGVFCFVVVVRTCRMLIGAGNPMLVPLQKRMSRLQASSDAQIKRILRKARLCSMCVGLALMV